MATKCIIVIVLLATLFVDEHSSIKIDIQPQRFTGNEPNVQINCRLDRAELSAREILLLKIEMRGMKAVALTRSNKTVSYVNANQDEFSATGQLNDPVNSSYLDLIIKNPLTTDAGMYICKMYYTDASGTLMEVQASASFTVDDQEITRLKERIKALEESKSSEQKFSPLIAFSAMNKANFLQPKYNQVLVFPDVIMQMGQGYSNDTGIFTAPVSGLYAFSLVIETSCMSCLVDIDIMANDKTLVTVKAGNANQRDQSSVNTVVKLQPGDKVVAKVASATQGTSLTFQKHSVFSGYLIQVA